MQHETSHSNIIELFTQIYIYIQKDLTCSSSEHFAFGGGGEIYLRDQLIFPLL